MTDYAVESSGVTADGSLRYERRLGDYEDYRHDHLPAWSALIDARSGSVLLDCAACTQSTIFPTDDGDLTLFFSINRFDRLYRIDPASGQAWDLVDPGPPYPLADLQRLVDTALQARPATRRAVASDGSVRVDLDPVEWGNGNWVFSPQVREIATDRVVLDLWGSDWDTSVYFPGPSQVQLGLSRRHHGGYIVATIDLARNVFAITREYGRDTAGEEQPLAGMIPALEAAAARAADAARRDPGKPPAPPPPTGVAWRAIVLIVIGSAIAIAVGTWLSLHFYPEPEQKLTPLPKMPSLERPPH